MRSVKGFENQDLLGDSAAIGTTSVSLAKLFGAEFGKQKMRVAKFETNHHLIPRLEKGYAFRYDILEPILNYLENPNGDALYLFGPSGCGKTSAVLQVCSLLKLPVLSLTLNGRFELSDLIGHSQLIDGNITFIHGALARAMKYGYVLILNEIDLAEPAELAGLNDVLEGRCLNIVSNNGEIIEPHPNFRFVVTANTKGDNCMCAYGKFMGTQMLNSAFLDRFRYIDCSYLEKDAEINVLTERLPNLCNELINKLVEIAIEIRNSCFSVGQPKLRISIPLSTRSLLRWARLIEVYVKAKHQEPILKALKHSYTARLREDEAQFVCRLVADKLGSNPKVFKDE